MTRPRIVIAEQYRLVRDAVARVLEPSCCIVGAVGDGPALLEAASSLRPDIVLLDVEMPPLHGLDTARLLRKTHPHIKLILLARIADAIVLAEAYRLGASALVLKTCSARDLLHVIHEVSAGQICLTPLAAKDAPDVVDEPASLKQTSELSGRQREVLQLLAEGRTMKSIARVLNITPRTVAFHKYNMMEDLNIRSNAELVRYAVKLHMVGV